MSFGVGTRVGLRKRVAYYVGVTLAPPVEYHCTIHVRRRRGLMPNNIDLLLLLRRCCEVALCVYIHATAAVSWSTWTRE